MQIFLLVTDVLSFGGISIIRFLWKSAHFYLLYTPPWFFLIVPHAYSFFTLPTVIARQSALVVHSSIVISNLVLVASANATPSGPTHVYSQPP